MRRQIYTVPVIWKNYFVGKYVFEIPVIKHFTELTCNTIYPYFLQRNNDNVCFSTSDNDSN